MSKCSVNSFGPLDFSFSISIKDAAVTPEDFSLLIIISESEKNRKYVSGDKWVEDYKDICSKSYKLFLFMI